MVAVTKAAQLDNRITKIEYKLTQIEADVDQLNQLREDKNVELSKMVTDIHLLSANVNNIKDRQIENSMHLKEMILASSLSIKELGADFKIGMNSIGDKMAAQFAKVEPRITQLEEQKWKFSGAIALIAFMISVGVILFSKLIPQVASNTSNIHTPATSPPAIHGAPLPPPSTTQQNNQ